MKSLLNQRLKVFNFYSFKSLEKDHVLYSSEFIPKDIELRHNSHLLPNLPEIVFNIIIKDSCIALVFINQATQNVKKGRFSSSIVTHNAKQLSLLDFEVSVL